MDFIHHEEHEEYEDSIMKNQKRFFVTFVSFVVKKSNENGNDQY